MVEQQQNKLDAIVETLDSLKQYDKDYIEGFKDGLESLKSMDDSEGFEEAEDVEEEEQAGGRVADGIDLEERYPLEIETIEAFNPKRLEYELVIFFTNRENQGSMSTAEVVNAVWDKELDTQDTRYKKVQRVMRESRKFSSRNTWPKEYFLSPNADDEVAKEVIRP